MTTIPPVSNSEIGLFQRCRRHWWLKYELWLAVPSEEEPPTGNRELGLRVHQAFEGYAKSGFKNGPLFWVRQVYGAELLRYYWAADEVKKEQELAETMLEGYEDWAAENGLDENIEVVEAELDMIADLPGLNTGIGDRIQIRGRLDQLIRRVTDGALLFRDWKTVASLPAAADGLPLNAQMRFYTMLQRLANRDLKAEGGQVIYLKRSKRTARAAPPFYAVEEVRYNREMLNSTYLKTKGIITEMIIARQRIANGIPHQQVVPPSQMASCSWDCPFILMCPMMDDGEAWRDMAEGEFTRQDPYSYYTRAPKGGNNDE